MSDLLITNVDVLTDNGTLKIMLLQSKMVILLLS